MKWRVSRKGVIIMAVVSLLITGATGFGLWYVNSQNQIASGDADASGNNGATGCPAGYTCDDCPAPSTALVQVNCYSGGSFCGTKYCPQVSNIKNCKCCDGTIQATIPKDQSCNPYCTGNGGYGSCDDDDPGAQDCTCDSFAGCGTNCTFKAGTAAKVRAKAGDCGGAIAVCNRNNNGSKTISIETFGPGHECWGKTDQCKNPYVYNTCEEEPYCGDGTVDSGEQCDDGNDVDIGDSCRNNCTYCGDGIVNPAYGEQCDDGNKINTDSCNNNCKTVITPVCGDGNVDSGEQCDDGNNIDDDECRNDCTYPPAASCGDGNVDAGEECDPPGDTTQCTYGACMDNCTCPLVDADLTFTKVSAEVCYDTDAENVYSDVRYTLTLENNGTTNATISQVVDDLDDNIDASWLLQDTITPNTNVTVEGTQITWTMTGDVSIATPTTLQPGEQMVFQYTVRIPETGFGTYTNTATAYVDDEGLDDLVATDVAIVDCVLNETGLLDNTLGRVGLALVLIGSGVLYMYIDSPDRLVLKLVGKEARLSRRKQKFEESASEE